MDSNDYQGSTGLLASVVRFRWLVLLLVLLGGAAGYSLSAQRPALYQSSATLLLADPRNQTVLTETRQTSNDPSRYVRNQARFAISKPVVDRAAELLGVPAESLVVSAEAVIDVDTMLVTAVDPDPRQAAETADALALAYEQVRTEQHASAAQEAITQLQRARAEIERQLVAIEVSLASDPDSPAALAEREAATQQLQVLLSRERQLSVDTALFGGGVELREAAQVPFEPFQPQPRRAAGAAMLLMLVLASAAAWGWNTWRPKSVPRSHLESTLGAPMLGEVPRFSRHLGAFPAAVDPLSPEADAYQFLVAALSREMRKRAARSVLVTSAGPSDGKTATAVNMAIVAQRSGQRVVLVDGDVRARGLTALTEIEPPLSLEEVARGSAPVGHCLASPPVDGLEALRVAVIDSDDVSDNPAAFLRSPGFGRAVERLGEVADLVVVDSPPVLAVADTFEMAQYVDVVLVVVTPAGADERLANVKRRLDLAGATVIGYVLNRSGSREEAYVYGLAAVPESARHASPQSVARPAPASPAPAPAAPAPPAPPEPATRAPAPPVPAGLNGEQEPPARPAVAVGHPQVVPSRQQGGVGSSAVGWPDRPPPA